MGNRLVEHRAIHLVFTSIKLEKKLIFCLLFFVLTTTAGATEYIVNPVPGDQAGDSINGEKVVKFEDTVAPYWQFLLWLAAMQILSIMDTLLYLARLIFAILGFRIVDKGNVLDNPNREQIYAYIEYKPGVYFSEIVKNMGLNRGTVQYHIRILKAQNKIEAYKDGGKTRYFQSNFMYSEKEMKILAVLQNNTNQRIISEISKGSCCTNVTLAQEIGVSRGTISWYTNILREIGLIKETKGRRGINYIINTSCKFFTKIHK